METYLEAAEDIAVPGDDDLVSEVGTRGDEVLIVLPKNHETKKRLKMGKLTSFVP